MIGMILAGGGGTRLWPYSRTMIPKQFLNLGSTHESLLQETYQRLRAIAPMEKIYIVGAKAHEFELKRQIQQIEPAFPLEHILLEPLSRNTAPAILWGLLRIAQADQEEPLVILPADHLIRQNERFVDYLSQGERLALSGKIVTFGIRPDRPETGYGYIKAGNPLELGYEVARFVEKPDRAKAEEYIQSAEYTWNAGIFMSRPKVLLEEYRRLAPDLYRVFEQENTQSENLLRPEIVESIYRRVVSESVDYAILEKSQRVAVLPADMEWSDLGSWESIYQVSAKDKEGNVTRGNVISRDTRHCLIFSTKKLVTSIGVENLIIVETDDALLVCDLSRSQDVKHLVDTLKEEERAEYQFHTQVLRPWGSYTVLYEVPGYKIKLVEVLPGKRMSLQRHRHRIEHWVVVKGIADVTRGHEQFFMTENESTYIPQTMLHRLGNSGKIPLQLIEVQQGSYLEEDDIERFDDDFGRETSPALSEHEKPELPKSH